MDKNISVGSVVYYDCQFYLLWNINKAQKAQLITAEGTKFSGTPSVEKLEVLKKLPIVRFNNGDYVVDRFNRIFSLRTGNQVYSTNCPERGIILGEVGRA